MATLFIGQNKIFLTEVDSTNSYASSLLKNVNPPEGTVVYAGYQTQGKGQRGNSWKAEPSRNITLSLILKPVFLNIEKSFYLSKIAALSLYDVLTELLPAGQFDIKIKWPNDILLNSRKVAGILLENGFKENYITNCITGIGLNVNQLYFGELSAAATSLAKETNREFDLEGIMVLLFRHYEKWYLQLRNRKLEEINAFYLERLFKMNTIAEFEYNSKRFEAKIKGVGESGLLLLEMNGTVSSFDIKDVKLIY